MSFKCVDAYVNRGNLKVKLHGAVFVRFNPVSLAKIKLFFVVSGFYVGVAEELFGI